MVIVLKTRSLQPSLHGDMSTGDYKEIMAEGLHFILGPSHPPQCSLLVMKSVELLFI